MKLEKPNNEDTIIKVVRGTGVFTAQRFINSVLGALIFVYAAQMLTKTEMGVYGSANMVYSIATLIASLGLPTAASRFTAYLLAKHRIAEAHITVRNIAILTLAAATTLSCILFLFSQDLSQSMLGTYEFAQTFQILSLTAFITVLSSTSAGFLLGLQKFRQLASIYMAAQTTRFALTVFLLKTGHGVPSIFLGLSAYNLLIAATALPIAFIGLHTRGYEKGKVTFSLRPLLAFTIPMAVYAAASYIFNAVDSFMVLGLLGVEELGLYTASVTVTSFTLTVLGVSFSDTVTSCMSHTYGIQGNEALVHETRRLSRYASFIFIPAATGLAALSPLIVKILGEQKYQQAAPLITISSIGLILYYIPILIISALVAVGKTAKAMQIMALTLLTGIGPCAILTRNLGVTGTAVSKALLFTILLGISVKTGRKAVPLSFDKGAILASITASTVMGLAVYSIAVQTGFTLVLLPLYTIAGVAIFTAILITTKTIKMEDIQLLLKTIPKGEAISQKIFMAANNSKIIAKIIRKMFS
ncbi:MAG: oligosaccharide flippase family protein [Candidatus Bathyarchaeia archaeon]